VVSPGTQTTPDQFLAALPPDRREPLSRVRDLILRNLPPGYAEGVAYGMITYTVPLDRYPNTYNRQPLLYAALANQKRYVTLHLMNVYSNADRAEAFRRRFLATGRKPDIGKSCARFRQLEDLPLELIAETVAAAPVEAYIGLVTSARMDAQRQARANR
jgi:hypothetical protein